MSASAATLTVDSFAEIAKTTLKPMRCESTIPEVCMVILSCWEALRLHYLHVHCVPTRASKESPKEYRCSLSRCSAPIHHSRESLVQHIHLSHLNRISLPCPFRQCAGAEPHRTQTFLIDHLEAVHADCQSMTLESLHEELSPSWRPSRFPPLLSPPPLPVQYTDVLVTVSLPPRKRKTSSLDDLSPGDQAGRGSTLPPDGSQSPRKSQIPRQISRQTIDSSEDGEEIHFDDLQPITQSNQDFVVWRRPEALKKDVSSAVHLHDHSNCSEPPASILYDIFSRRFDQLRKIGVVADETE